jgi:predicted HTH domain antitoxin
MNVEVNIPDEIFSVSNSNVSREVLEAVAAEGFRSDQLTLAQVRRLLGFETRYEAEQFLAGRGIAWVKYSVEDAQRESEAWNELLG